MINSYWNPVKIVIGRGSLARLPQLLANRTAILVTTQGMVQRGVVKRIQDLCGSSLVHITSKVRVNPTLVTIGNCFHEVRKYDYDLVIGLGGGSALDTAKIVALLSGGSITENWLEAQLRHGEPKFEDVRAKPLITIPTTSGSGSEVTPWATVWDDTSKDKHSVRDTSLFAEWALLDADLTDSLTYQNTLFPALDALSHSMEAIWNKHANPVSDVLAAKSISISVPILLDSFRDKYTLPAVRDKLQLASLLAGLAFSNTRTALAHSISYPFTTTLGMPHGLACSFTLPEIMKHNCKYAEERVGIIIEALGCSTIDAAIEKLWEMFRNAGVPDYVRDFSLNFATLNSFKANLIKPDRAENNIANVSQRDATQIVRSALSNLLPEK